MSDTRNQVTGVYRSSEAAMEGLVPSSFELGTSLVCFLVRGRRKPDPQIVQARFLENAVLPYVNDIL